MKLALLAEAEAELDDATAWYDEQRDGLGDELLLEVHDALAIIVDAPRLGHAGPGRPHAFHQSGAFFCSASPTRSRTRRTQI